MSRIGGSGWTSDAQRQWQPTLTVHEPGTTLSLESPLGDQPYQTGVRSRRPFTGVIFGRGREGAVVTAAKAMAFAIVTLAATDRTAYARTRDANVTFQRAPVVACPVVTFDASSSSPGNGTNTVTWSHTCSGSDRLLLVMANSFFADGEVTGVTYNGVALSSVGAYATTDPRQSIWSLVAPDTGTHNVTVTFAGPASANGFVSAISFNNAHQTTPTGTFASNSGVSSSQSVTSADTDSRGMIASIVGDYSGSVITIASGTTRETRSGGFAQMATQDGGTATTSWTTPGADTWTASGVLVKPLDCGPVTATKPTVPTVVQAQQRRRRTVDTVFLRNPQAPAATPAAKAMPFTIVTQYAVQRARLTARPTGEVAQTPTPDRIVKPVVVSLVGKRVRRPRPVGRVVFQRESPANFDADGSVPITTVIQQSRQFFRRPVTHVVFQRNPVQTPAAPAVKAPPFVVVSLVPERQPVGVHRKPGFRYLRNPQLPPNPNQPKVVSLIPERQPVTVRRKGYARFVRNPQPPIYTKAVPPVIVSLVPERRPLKPYRYARTTFIHTAPPAPGPVGPPDWIYRLTHRNPYPKLTLRLPYINVSPRKMAPKLTKRTTTPNLSPRRTTYKEEKR